MRRRDSPGLLFLQLMPRPFLFGARTPSQKTIAAAALKRFWSRSRREAGDAAAPKPGVWARLGGSGGRRRGRWRQRLGGSQSSFLPRALGAARCSKITPRPARTRRRRDAARPGGAAVYPRAAGWRGGLLLPGTERGSLRGGAARRIEDLLLHPGAATRNRDSEAFVQRLLWLQGRGCLRHVSLGLCSLVYEGALRRPGQPPPGSLSLPAAPLDRLPRPDSGCGLRGPLVECWGADARLPGINDDEFLHLPAHLRIVRPHQLHSEANERLSRREIQTRGAHRRPGGPGAVGGSGFREGEEGPARLSQADSLLSSEVAGMNLRPPGSRPVSRPPQNAGPGMCSWCV